MKVGRKKRGLAGEIDVAALSPLLAGASEFLRMWATPTGPVTCLIDPGPIGTDPFAFGIALTDCVRHGAKAYAQATGIDEALALAAIWAGLDAERASPTAAPETLTGRKDLN